MNEDIEHYGTFPSDYYENDWYRTANRLISFCSTYESVKQLENPHCDQCSMCINSHLEHMKIKLKKGKKIKIRHATFTGE